MRTGLIAATLCLATALSGSARGDGSTDQASRLFKAGTDSYARRDFREAARQFESAYRIAPRGAAIYDAGLAWEQAGEPARAADDFATAIGNGDTNSQQRSDATARLKALEARLARLVVTGPADAHVTVDDGSASSLPLGVHLAPGTHALFVQYAGGRTETRDVDARAGAEVVVRLASPAVAASTDEPSSPSPPHEPPPRAADDGASTRRSLAWISLSGAGLAAVLGVYFYVQGSNALSSYEAPPADVPAKQNLHDEAVTDRTAAQVLAVVTVALAATWAVLYFTSSPSGSSTSLRVGPESAVLHVTF
jgi:tetratricopeptide (TPR) repeat protein